MPITTSFGQILLKHAENVSNGKNGIPHFLFKKNEYERRYLCKTIFETFLTVRIFYHSNLTRFLGDLA
jgi:hypothetical protein